MWDWLWGKTQPPQPTGETNLRYDRVLEESDLERVLRFGSLYLHDNSAMNHFLAVGTTGSGKTTLLRIFIQSFLWRLNRTDTKRVLIYDPKLDFLSILQGINPNAQIAIFNAFDARGVAWHMARDIREPRTALEVGTILIPKEKDATQFFIKAGRDLLTNVMVSFIRRDLDWTLADVLRAVRSPESLRNVLQACPETQGQIDRYFGDTRLLLDIISTLGAELQTYEPVAFAWEKAERRVSITEWLEGGFVILMGNSEISREAINAINRCIFHCASDQVLNLGESSELRFLFVIDETTEAGNLDKLPSLIKKGRSKGVSVCLAFQSIAGLRDPELYGKSKAAEILGQIGHRWIGRIECPETAQWAADVVGEQQIRQTTVSETYSAYSSTTHQEQFPIQKTVLPSEFMSIPACNVENGLSGFYVSPITGVYYDTIPGKDLFHCDLLPPAAGVSDFEPRPAEDQYFRPWSEEQRRLFAPRPEEAKGGEDFLNRATEQQPHVNLNVLDDLADL